MNTTTNQPAGLPVHETLHETGREPVHQPTMKAAVHTRYGAPQVIRVQQAPRPTPAPDEALIRVHTSTVNRTDCGMRSAKPFITRFFAGLRRPKHQVLGSEVAGVIEAVGSAVTEFAVGDRVFGVNAVDYGSNAEYICMRQAAPLATMPANVTFQQAAAATDGAVLAMTYLRRVRLDDSHRILVYGASGAIGSAGVQLAKHYGAHVTAVCDTRTLPAVQALNPDVLIDRNAHDFTTNGETYDFVFDAVGKLSFRRCRRSLTPGGAYLVTDLGFLWQNPWLALFTSRLTRRRKVLFPLPAYTKEKVQFIRQLLASGELRPVIDRSYPLDDIVAATEYVETQQKIGNVVIEVQGEQ
ncbi:MAG: NAD(P)-dependent alcohol dehydrogenase [Actinomycetota bacterium]|nr:NAD(P)-dependent alcohol dehydrogenase [Actinomycetota bacterium]